MALQPAAYSRFALPLLVLHLASACGGGSKPPPAEEDTTPPVTRATPAGGTFTVPVSVSLLCDDGSGGGCAETHYTTDGSTPTLSSPRYSTPLSLSATTALKFFSVDRLGNSESARTESYTFTADVAPPTTTASPAGGVYATAQNVTLVCDDGTGGSGCSATYYKRTGAPPRRPRPATPTPSPSAATRS